MHTSARTSTMSKHENRNSRGQRWVEPDMLMVFFATTVPPIPLILFRPNYTEQISLGASLHLEQLFPVRPAYRQLLPNFDWKDGDQGGADRSLTDDWIPLNFRMVRSEQFVKLQHGLIWGWQIAIQRNAVLWVSLKTVPRRTFPLNCNKEPFCNICERFEAERIFAVFTAWSTSLRKSGFLYGWASHPFPRTTASGKVDCQELPEGEGCPPQSWRRRNAHAGLWFSCKKGKAGYISLS